MKIIVKIKNIFAAIADKTAPLRDFFGNGQLGALVLLTVIGAQFLGDIFNNSFFDRMQLFFCFFIAVIVYLLSVELFRLVLCVFFGKTKRPGVYFLTSLTLVSVVNISSVQNNLVLQSILMSFALTVFADLMGRVLWGFIKTGVFKFVTAYLLGGLSLIYIVLYAVFYHYDGFGNSRIDFYNSIEGEQTGIVEGFSDYLKNGSYEVCSLSYGPDAEDDIVTESIDLTDFKDSIGSGDFFNEIMRKMSQYDFANSPIKGQIWYPKGQDKCPVLFIVHGNHSSATPSYLGYHYLGEYLASNGYVVVSVDENIINELGAGNDLRAYLLLENMRVILDMNEQSGNVLSGLIDADKIAIGGHSRGGEMAATAFLFNELDSYPENGNINFDYHFNISSIVAVSPCVDQYKPLNRSVVISDVNYLLLHGSNDQDVSSMMGEKQYNNIIFSDESDEFYFKSSVYILGANHGQFNSLWGNCDMPLGKGYLNTNNFIDENEQQLIAKAYIRTFLDATLLGENQYISIFSDITSFEGDLPDTIYITNYSDSETNVICSFDDSVDIGKYNNDVTVDVDGAENWTIDPYRRGSGGEREDFVLFLSWKDKNEPCVNISFSPIDISNGYISFSLADMSEGTEDKDEMFDYTVRLIDSSGNIAEVNSPVTVYPSLAVQLWKQDVIFGTYEYKHQLQRVMISPSMFENAAFDYSSVVEMEILTDGFESGKMIIDDISYRNDIDN